MDGCLVNKKIPGGAGIPGLPSGVEPLKSKGRMNAEAKGVKLAREGWSLARKKRGVNYLQ